MSTDISHSTTTQPEHLTHPKYRADIDGLRAIAVLSVVIFHAFPKLLGGGFIGVDIFFVISGFLISTIIMSSLERDSFSFVEFYSRRVKRIFPALLLVLSASFAFGWFMLLADEYKQLGKHIAGGAGFISNFLFWNESGYFDNAAETKPLLHLWSLGIEEQFYIIWPLLLWLSWKNRFSLLKSTIIVIAISFALNVVKVQSDTVAAFYSPQTRFWELLVGSVLAYLTLHKRSLFPKFNNESQRNIQSMLGAILIAFGVFVITKEKHFPGWWAILPTLGTLLIISAGMQGWFNRVVLSNRVLVWFGLISFPLYLWHWPLLAFARIKTGEMPSAEVRVAVVLISILLAWLTYRLIEKPIRFGNHSKAKTAILCISMIVVGYTGFDSYKQEGLSFRAYPAKFQTYTQSIIGTGRASECFEIPFAYSKKENWYCNLGDKAIKPRFFAYGDSHALSLIPALEKYSVENKQNILFTGASGCPPLLGVQSMRGVDQIRKYDCQKLNERVFNFVKDNKINSVLLISRWTYYTGGTTRPEEFNYISMNASKETTPEFSRLSFEYGLKQTIEKYNSIGVMVYIFEDNPYQINNPRDALKRASPTDDSINKLSVSFEEHKNNQSWVSGKFKDIDKEMATIVGSGDALCIDDRCPLVYKNKSLYLDSDHLSISGAMLAYPIIRQTLSATAN